MKPQENPCADILNPNLKGRDICEAFADYQILLVADQFQTGFDQPLTLSELKQRRFYKDAKR